MHHSVTIFTSFVAALISISVSAQQTAGQELVRNGGFEMLDKGVKTYDQFTAATGWTNASLAMSEMFERGASHKTVGIPINDYGTMEPFEGAYYAGFFGWKDDVRRDYGSSDPEELFMPGWNAYSEYLTSELIKPLVKGKTYEVVFRLALSQNSDRTILGLGAHFSRVPVLENHRKFLEHVPDVYLKELIMEKGKWIEVRGKFKSLGDERYIVLGVFPYVGLESEDVVEGHDNRYAYYYIDGVSLMEVIQEGD